MFPKFIKRHEIHFYPTLFKSRTFRLGTAEHSKSLQRNRAGEGTVTIHQDPKITGLIGSIYTEMLREVSRKC